jgi:hypothetical protein
MTINLKKTSLQQADGIPLQARAPRVGSEVVLGSHNFCDQTTWFGDSVRATDQAMEAKAGSSGLIWKSTSTDPTHINWIDMRSGRIHNQEKWAEEQEHGYVVEVKVNGTTKVQCPIFIFDDGDTGGGPLYDYWVDYDAGEVNFFVDQTGNTVTASFSYATTSNFYVIPTAGKILRIEDAEADFSGDMVLETSFGYTVRGYVDVFAPQYMRGSNELDPVITASETDPPGSPDVGDRYLVAEGGTGAWTGLDGAIVEWSGSEWSITAPQAEDWTTVLDIEMYLTFRNGTWNPTPFPSGTKIPLQEDYYHRVTQIITEARGALPAVAAIGATSEHQALSDIKEFRRKSRGMKHSVQAVPFNYSTARELVSSAGMDLVVNTVNNTVVGGEMLTMTFYCTSKDEEG